MANDFVLAERSIPSPRKTSRASDSASRKASVIPLRCDLDA